MEPAKAEATLDDFKEAKFMDAKKTLQVLSKAQERATPGGNSKALDMRRPVPNNRTSAQQPQSGGFLAAPTSSSSKHVVYRQHTSGTDKANFATSSTGSVTHRARSRDRVLGTPGVPATSSFSFAAGKAPRGRTQSPPTSAVLRTVSREAAKLGGLGSGRSTAVAVTGGSVRGPTGAGSVTLTASQTTEARARPKSPGTYTVDMKARPKSPGGTFSFDVNRVFPMLVKDAVPATKHIAASHPQHLHIPQGSVKIESPPISAALPAWMKEAATLSPRTSLSDTSASAPRCEIVTTSDEATVVPEMFSASMDAVVKAMAAYSMDAQKQIEEFINRKVDAALQELQSFVDRARDESVSAPLSARVARDESFVDGNHMDWRECTERLLDMQRQLDSHKDSAVEVLRLAQSTTTLASDLRNDMEAMRTLVDATSQDGLRDVVMSLRSEVDSLMAAQLVKMEQLGVKPARAEAQAPLSRDSISGTHLEAVLQEVVELRARTEQIAAGDAARAVKLSDDLREANQRWVEKTSVLQACMEDSINAITASISTMQSQIREWHESTYARRQTCDDEAAMAPCTPATTEAAALEAPDAVAEEESPPEMTVQSAKIASSPGSVMST